MLQKGKVVHPNLVDKTDADIELDYSKLKADIKTSIESNNFMLPSVVEQQLSNRG